MRRFIIMLAIAISTNSILYAQQTPVVKMMGNCNIPSACEDCGMPKATFGKADSLSKYFRRHIDEAKLETVEGVIGLQVMVDATGKACCYSISNRSNVVMEYITSLKLDKIINSMSKWRPAVMNKKPVNSSVLLLLHINTSEQTIRVAYSRTDVQYVKKSKAKKAGKRKTKARKAPAKKTA